MRGTNSITGKPLDGLDHLKQSVADILTTPVGSRVMRRDYGSRLFELIDSPVTSSRLIEFYAAIVDALNKWEPRVSITKIAPASVSAGRIAFTLTGTVTATGAGYSQTISL